MLMIGAFLNTFCGALMLLNGTFPLSVNGTSAGVRTMGRIDTRFNIHIYQVYDSGKMRKLLHSVIQPIYSWIL